MSTMSKEAGNRKAALQGQVLGMEVSHGGQGATRCREKIQTVLTFTFLLYTCKLWY